MQSIFARAIITFIAVFHGAYFVVALATLRFPELIIGVGFPVLAAGLWMAYRPIPAVPDRSFGGGMLVARVALDPHETMLLDVPVRWNNFPVAMMGHLLVTDCRIVRSPFGFGISKTKPSEIQMKDLARVERYKAPSGILSWFTNEGDNIDIVGGSSTLRVRPTPGPWWMGGYSVDALERDIRDALDRGGWNGQERHD
jgi:hypothetical protein